MYEVEVKVPADHTAVRDALVETDTGRDWTVAQADTYFDAPHRDFAVTDEALRVRRAATAEPSFDPDEDTTDAGVLASVIDRLLDGDSHAGVESRLTYKGPLVDAESKTREEFETTVGSGEDLREILGHLGFEPAATVRKLREGYHVGAVTVLLDAVEDVGEYVEVEVDVETAADVDAAREDACAVLERLGLDPDEQIRTSYLGLKLGTE